MASAPIYQINANNDGHHQISPSWAVIFWPCNEPRTGFHPGDPHDTQDKIQVGSPVVVLNDCVSVSVNRSKADHIKTATMTLKLTDYRYDQNIKPNDYVSIWMCEWEDDINAVVNSITGGQGVDPNYFNSGLKFIGKVKSLSKSVSVSDEGVPTEIIQIQATMFSELNMSVYVSRLYETFNSATINIQNPDIKDLLFLQYLDPKIFEAFIKPQNGDQNPFKTPDQVAYFFSRIFLGEGPGGKDVKAELGFTSKDNIGNKIIVPKDVYAKILGTTGFGPAFIDNTDFYMGVEQYDTSASPNDIDALSPATVPGVTIAGSYIRSTPLKGGIILSAGLFENITLYTLLQNHLNDVCNELFTTMRYNPTLGGIRPSIVMRQIPFSTPQIDQILAQNKKINKPQGNASLLTKYKNLPRWQLDTTRIKSINVGLGNAAHVNMVQIFTTPIWSNLVGVNNATQEVLAELQKSAQYALGNLIFDEADILKNGLRAYIKEVNFESIDLQNTNKNIQNSLGSPYWGAMQADFLFNLDQKLSGQISITGIQEPICEGDNLEVDGILYHIENIEHTCQLFPSGNKKFVTILTVSNGTYAQSLEDITSFNAYFPTKNIPHTSYDRFGLTDLQGRPDGSQSSSAPAGVVFDKIDGGGFGNVG